MDIVNSSLVSALLYRILADGAIIVGLLLLLRTQGPLSNNLCGWKKPSTKDILIGTTGALVLFALILSITTIISQPLPYDIHLTINIYKAFVLLFITSITEELFYRGFFLKKLLQANIPLLYSIIISSLVFGLAHMYLGLGGVLFSIMSGMILAYMVITYKSITTSIVAHVIYNFLYYTLHLLSNS